MAEDHPEDSADKTIGAPEGAGTSDAARPPREHGGTATPDLRGTGVSAGLVIGVLLAILAIVIAVQNTTDVRVTFLAWEIDAPLVAVILAAVVAGVLLDETLGIFWRRRKRRHLAERVELRRLRRR